MIKSEVVPVRRVNDIFVAQLWIASLEFADDVVRFKGAKLLLDVDISLCIEHLRPELFCNRRLLQRVKILTASGQQLLRGIERHPRARSHGVRVLIWRIDLVILLAPTRSYHGIRVSSRLGLVDDHSGCSAFLCCDLVFVSPATVVGHRFPFKHFFIEFG